ncbi:MAG: HEPN domain protein [Candidatus Scalindua rubra]|uniref:HEPN domain protein n=1 Tax=Candidatus Scalindua rubra TaxID=1872076 RepID=A0A1E3XFI6_9BACT|nr:MAG: HEPN domain protein [Candidatus Scalindua rubra]
MNDEKDLKEVLQYWLEKSEDSLAAAKDELKAGRLSFSVNRIYYACFYIITAILLQKKLRFQKHSGVRAAFHKHFVKPGLVSREDGQFYDELFEARQRGDYIELVSFENETVTKWLKQANKFVETIKSLILKNQ